MAGQAGIADALLGDLRKGGLERGQQLGLELVVQLVAGVGLGHVAADVGVEENGVADTVGILAEAADADVNVDASAGIHHAEGHGGRGAVLVAHDLLGVEVVNALILGSLAAEGEALADLPEDRADAFTQAAAEDGGLGGRVIDKLARLGAELGDLALLPLVGKNAAHGTQCCFDKTHVYVSFPYRPDRARLIAVQKYPYTV